jgi:hypothetical protein
LGPKPVTFAGLLDRTGLLADHPGFFSHFLRKSRKGPLVEYKPALVYFPKHSRAGMVYLLTGIFPARRKFQNPVKPFGLWGLYGESK